MSFGNPWVLLGLALPILLLVFTWRRRPGSLVLPYDNGRVGRGLVVGSFLRVAESLPPLLLAVAVVLLAGPQKLSVPKTKRALTNIQFCVDISGSMTAKFGDGSRYDASMRAIDKFLDMRQGDAFGLSFFGNAVMHWVPLTSDASAFRCAPPFMRPESAPPGFGGTEIGKALLACREVLMAREEGDRLIILVSDGFSADLGGDRDDEVTRKLRDAGIVLYAVHIADSQIPAEIIDISRLSGGDAFNPEDQGALERAFKHIDEMQVTKFEKETGEHIDDFEPWCILGLAILGLHALLQFWLRFTPW